MGSRRKHNKYKQSFRNCIPHILMWLNIVILFYLILHPMVITISLCHSVTSESNEIGPIIRDVQQFVEKGRETG